MVQKRLCNLVSGYNVFVLKFPKVVRHGTKRVTIMMKRVFVLTIVTNNNNITIYIM